MKSFYYGILISVLLFIIFVFTLKDYGLNEDSPFHFLKGQAYLNLLLKGKVYFDIPKLSAPSLFIPGQRISQYKLNAWENNLAPIRKIDNYKEGKTIQELFEKYQKDFGRKSFYKSNAWSAEYFLQKEGPGHPPISDILASLFNKIFYEKLGLLGDVEAYYLYPAACAALAVFFIFIFVAEVWGSTAALFSVLFLAFSPIFFAEAHFNIKDIPELAFFSISIISFYFFVAERRWKWIIVFTLSFFLALGTKFNIVFLSFILIPWLFYVRKTEGFKWFFSKKIIPIFIFFTIFNLIFLIILWPYLWNSPFQKLWDVIQFYSQTSNIDPRIQKLSSYNIFLGMDFTSILLVFTTTPIFVVIFFLVGLITLLVRKSEKSQNYHEGILIFLWLLIPIARVVRPYADAFGSIRSFMEFRPAFNIIASLGVISTITLSTRLFKNQKKIISVLAFVALFFFLAYINISYHPNQNVFFNSLIGGPRGAEERGLYVWQTSYDNPYRQAVNWLNLNVPKNAALAYLDGTMTAISPIWLRKDIHFGSYFSGLEQKGEYVVSIVYPSPPKVFAYLYLERFLNPVYEIKVDGLTILKIWKNDPKYLKDKFRNVHKLPATGMLKRGSERLGEYWEIQLDKPYTIVSLVLNTPNFNTVGRKCGARQGLFYLDDYIVPERRDKKENTTEFYFPATVTNKIRYYPIIKNSCFLAPKVLSIMVADDNFRD